MQQTNKHKEWCDTLKGKDYNIDLVCNCGVDMPQTNNIIERFRKEFGVLWKDTSGAFGSSSTTCEKEVEHFIQQELKSLKDEMEKIYVSDSELADLIYKVLGSGRHYSTMPVARGIVKTIKQEIINIFNKRGI